MSLSLGTERKNALQKIEGRDVELERLAAEIEKVRVSLNKSGEALRQLRAKAAPKLSENIRRNLRDLGFANQSLKPSWNHSKNHARMVSIPSSCFLAKPGRPVKPLRTIASSGEISRLMLAIKSALAAQDAIPLLIFDEIDTNVGGEIGHAIGAKMQTLAKEHQVICITHLAPVAAVASTHFVVTRMSCVAAPIHNCAKSPAKRGAKKSHGCSGVRANRHWS